MTNLERITKIEPITVGKSYYSEDSGFRITTTDQAIDLLISDSAGCCESWGYFLTEDDTDKFIGAQLLGVDITDVNLSNKVFDYEWYKRDPEDDREYIGLDGGDVMFVNISTSVGVLQFVAYNSHNGYYGHSATVKSKQLTYETVL